MYNELDCPLLELSEHYKIIPSSAVIAPVTILHECDNYCKFIAGTKQTDECEEYINKGLLNYAHNFVISIFVSMCMVKLHAAHCH